MARLRFSSAEARAIASLAPAGQAEQFAGPYASLRTVKSLDWAGYSIAHFAAHAWMNPAHPELAGVALSTFDREARPQPGVLWFSDIAGLHMRVNLVTLSACSTANGELLPGEGLVGLSYSFLLGGARRVVGSLWNVDDVATEVLMRAFYTSLLRDHASPAEALRRAQRYMASTPAWSNPYYWAGFTIEGKWRPAGQ
jgi:CHAT domain-containing protein